MANAGEIEKAIRDFALELPQTDEAFPWGERALRVRGKAFVFMRLSDGALSFSVKLRRSRAHALALPFVHPTHYGLGRHGWVTIEVRRATRALMDQFEEWIIESFRAVAPKRVAELLDADSSRVASKRSTKRPRSGRVSANP